MNPNASARFRRPGTRRPPLIWAWIVFLGILSPLYLIAAETEKTNATQNTRAVIEKWIETQRIISQEKRDLVLAREMLNERIALVQREIESLKNKISEANASVAESDRKRTSMVDENDSLKQATAGLGSILSNMEGRVRHMIARLPDPIRERIKPLSQRLPNDSEQTKQSTSERFQNIVGILNEVDKFSRDISATSEVRTLADGSSVEVAVLYLGIGQAFYTSSDTTIAGTGTASDTVWTWQPNNPAAVKIAEAIAILKNEKVASFVQLPVEIK
jgi:FtsZ-binding cell division protein ZapB